MVAFVLDAMTYLPDFTIKRHSGKISELLSGVRLHVLGIRCCYESQVSWPAIGAPVKCWRPKIFLSIKAFLELCLNRILPTICCKECRRFLVRRKRIQLLSWSAYSPDTLTVEHVWGFRCRNLVRDACPTASIDKLWIRVQTVLNTPPLADIQKVSTLRSYFGSSFMPLRIAAQISMCGRYIKHWYRAHFFFFGNLIICFYQYHSFLYRVPFNSDDAFTVLHILQIHFILTFIYLKSKKKIEKKIIA